MASETGQLQCTNCGANLRPGASFCSKCGTRYSRAADAPPAPRTPAAVSDAWLKADIVNAVSEPPAEPEFQKTIADSAPISNEAVETVEDSGDDQETQLSMPVEPAPRKSNVIPIREGMAESGSELESELESGPETETVVSEQSPVRARPRPEKAPPMPANTAAMRNRPKLQREKIEMVWEQPDNGVNVWFIVGSLVVVAIVITVIVTAWTIR